MTAVVPLARLNSLIKRWTLITGYFAEIVPLESESPLVPVSTQLSREEIVGTIETLMSPLVPIRGVTSSEIPHEKNASFANINLSSPGIASIFEAISIEVEPLASVRFAETLTFGYFFVISTMAFLPDETIILGLEKVLVSSVASRARKVSAICEKLRVPLK